jgi:uncharacterized protein YjbI with pentapeptide repeats
MKLWKLIKYFYSLFAVPDRRLFDLEIVRTIISFLSLFATIFAGLGFYFSYQQGEQRLISDRFAQAVAQIGNENNLTVRIGGIYSLEKIARDAPDNGSIINEVLVSYIHTQSALTGVHSDKDYMQMKKIGIDTQAVLTVIKRRKINLKINDKLDLSSTNLKGANLESANLESVNLEIVNLEQANLQKINLNNANLQGAYLAGANLIGASLVRANLQKTNMTGVNLEGADLDGTSLGGANIDGAYFVKVRNITPDQIKGALNWQKAFYEPKFQKELGLTKENLDL